MRDDLRQLPHVVIIGGGFGGIYAARTFRQTQVRVTIIDRRNHHLFQPLLYQVASAALTATTIASPIRSIFADEPNIEVVLGEAVHIDVEGKAVQLADGLRVGYDFLIVAAGLKNVYFGHDEWEKHAPGLKTVEEALEIRRRMLCAFEVAERVLEPAARAPWLTFVVVGAGPTGVEMAGALAEIAHRTMVREYRGIDPSESRVILVEGMDRVLPAFDPVLSEHGLTQLRDLGVEVLLDTRVSRIDEEGVDLQSKRPDGTVDTTRLATRTVVWAAGVAAEPIARSLGVPLDRAGRVPVTPELLIPGRDDVYVIGDLAVVAHPKGGTVPQLAPGAIQQGPHAAKNILATLHDESRKPFRYWDKGLLATIGRNSAVGQVGRLKLSGVVAWLAWAFVHLIYLVGFRNQILVLIEWAWAYFTFQRGARLILGAPNIKELAGPYQLAGPGGAAGTRDEPRPALPAGPTVPALPARAGHAPVATGGAEG